MQISSIKRCKIPNQILLTESKYIKDNLHKQILNRSYYPNKIRILWRETKDGGYVFSTEDEMGQSFSQISELEEPANIWVTGELGIEKVWTVFMSLFQWYSHLWKVLASSRNPLETCSPYTSKKPGPDNETSFLQDVVVDPSACSGLLSKSHWILICCWQRQSTWTFIPTSLIVWPGWNLLLIGQGYWLG